jgi:hypothetical protein
MINIYKITSGQTPKVYIGSTAETIGKRLCGHKGQYKRYVNGLRPNVSSFEIVQHDDVQIELIKQVNEIDRYTAESEAIKDVGRELCVNVYDPERYAMRKRKLKKDQDNFTETEENRVQGAKNENSKCALKHYYRYKEQRLKYCCLRRLAKLGQVPKDSTIAKYNITPQEITSALKKFKN